MTTADRSPDIKSLIAAAGRHNSYTVSDYESVVERCRYDDARWPCPDRLLIDALAPVYEAAQRTRHYVEMNLAAWDDPDDNHVALAIADVYRKVLNVYDTGNPLRAALERTER